MTRRLTGLRRLRTPRTAPGPHRPPALVAVALLVVWATRPGRLPAHPLGAGRADRAGAAGDRAVAVVRLRLAEIPAPVRVAVLCLAAYTALSFLSILWAGVPGDAWEGANRTLLYLLVFALFACLAPARRERGAAAGRVDAGDGRARGLRRCCTSTPPASQASRLFAGRAPGLPHAATPTPTPRSG